MARAIWSGAISFGLVNVPVKAYPAVREHTVHFHQLERRTGSRIRYQKVSEKTGREVDADDIELGYEVGRGKHVVIDPDELDELKPRTTRTIDITDFVDLAEIDPVFYNNTYWLAPDGEPAERAYRLLQAVMAEEGRVGIGAVVMRNKQYLAAIRPLDRALAMSTLHFADEIVAAADIDQIPRSTSAPEPKERKLAAQIVGSLTTEWDPDRYHDTYTEELRDMLARRSKGQQVVVEEAPAARADVVDLMEALEASLTAAKKAKGGKVTRELERIADQRDGRGRARSKSARGGGQRRRKSA
jgi:DNA end-binding protein Ku